MQALDKHKKKYFFTQNCTCIIITITIIIVVFCFSSFLSGNWYRTISNSFLLPASIYFVGFYVFSFTQILLQCLIYYRSWYSFLYVPKPFDSLLCNPFYNYVAYLLQEYSISLSFLGPSSVLIIFLPLFSDLFFFLCNAEYLSYIYQYWLDCCFINHYITVFI